jgi:hypothetical protein
MDSAIKSEEERMSSRWIDFKTQLAVRSPWLAPFLIVLDDQIRKRLLDVRIEGTPPYEPQLVDTNSWVEQGFPWIGPAVKGGDDDPIGSGGDDDEGGDGGDGGGGGPDDLDDDTDMIPPGEMAA